MEGLIVWRWGRRRWWWRSCRKLTRWLCLRGASLTGNVSDTWGFVIFLHLGLGELSCNQPLSTAITTCKISCPFWVYDRFRHGNLGWLGHSTGGSQRWGFAGKLLVLTRGSVTGRYTRTNRSTRCIYAIEQEEPRCGGDVLMNWGNWKWPQFFVLNEWNSLMGWSWSRN